MSAAPDSLARRWASVAIVRRGRPLAVAVLLLLASVVAFSGAPVIERVRHTGFDAYQRLLPRARVTDPAVIVEIDEHSLARYGQWPWPRSLLARLVERIQAGGPFVIGLDMIFPERDRLSPDVIAESLPGHDASDLLARLQAQPSNDRLFAGALARARTVLGVAGFDRGRLPAGAVPHSVGMKPSCAYFAQQVSCESVRPSVYVPIAGPPARACAPAQMDGAAVAGKWAGVLAGQASAAGRRATTGSVEPVAGVCPAGRAAHADADGRPTGPHTVAGRAGGCAGGGW